MKKRLLLCFISIIFTVVIMSCTLENIVVSENSIYGSWLQLITDSQGVQFNAELKIKTDNSFDFILLENDCWKIYEFIWRNYFEREYFYRHQ